MSLTGPEIFSTVTKPLMATFCLSPLYLHNPFFYQSSAKSVAHFQFKQEISSFNMNIGAWGMGMALDANLPHNVAAPQVLENVQYVDCQSNWFSSSPESLPRVKNLSPKLLLGQYSCMFLLTLGLFKNSN